VGPKLLCGVSLRRLDAFDDVLNELFMPDSAVLALDKRGLLWLSRCRPVYACRHESRLDVLDDNSLLLSLCQQLATDVFGAFVDQFSARLAAPLDDPVEALDAGSRMLQGLLMQEGLKVGRLYVSTLTERMGIEALYRKPNTSKPAPRHKIFPYL
jgi:hypothetical protein